jgi:hypothetical protein
MDEGLVIIAAVAYFNARSEQKQRLPLIEITNFKKITIIY